MLSNNLKFIRTTIDHTQDEFAAIFSLPRSTYANYEQGNNEPTLAFMERLIDVTGIDFKTLMRVDLSTERPADSIRSMFIKHALKQASSAKTE